ncbi:MAG: hypothetical protein KAU35_03640, partial [candidate division Zixibacteria bacterium]|nr:hypothetical protein [candidate division Zixibacteria bacterium]
SESRPNGTIQDGFPACAGMTQVNLFFALRAFLCHVAKPQKHGLTMRSSSSLRVRLYRAKRKT